MHMFADDYGRRFGQGNQSPEAGIRITTIRVASYVEGQTVEFDASLLRPSVFGIVITEGRPHISNNVENDR
jgi:hypothetical protein